MLPTLPHWQPHQLAPVQQPATQQSAEDLEKLHSLYAQMVSLQTLLQDVKMRTQAPLNSIFAALT